MLKLCIEQLGLQPYDRIFNRMQTFTSQRDANTPDTLWFVEHPAVFTQGRHGKPEHILKTSDIPIVQTDRGGQITYHGPGQMIVYVLIDLKRRKMGPKQLVHWLEQATIKTLAQYSIDSHLRAKAPGVYVDNQKIASMGLRLTRGRSYHGLSLNINMDLSPFKMIKPCGLDDTIMTQISTFNHAIILNQCQNDWLHHFCNLAGYSYHD